MWNGLVPLVAGLLAVSLGAGCSKGGPKVDSNTLGTFKADFPMTEAQAEQVMGRSDFGKYFAVLRFTDTVRFRRIDETVDANAFYAVTFGDDGEAYTGKLTMRATLRKGYTGGPPGSATELFVEVNDVRLVGNLVRPKAPPGAKAILPGQIVVRKIKEGDAAHLDDRYVIEMPGREVAIVAFRPWREEYPFAVSVTRDGTPLTVRYDGKSVYSFDTTAPGLYEIRVRALRPSQNEPDRYHFLAYWGEGLSIGGPLEDQEIAWRGAPGGSPTPEPKR